MGEWNYEAGSGIWTLEIDDTIFKLHPKRGDKRRFIDYMKTNKKENKSALNKFEEFAYGIISRDYPPQTDQHEDKLKAWIELNNNVLMNEFMVFFRLTTREKIKELEEKQMSKMLETDEESKKKEESEESNS